MAKIRHPAMIVSEERRYRIPGDSFATESAMVKMLEEAGLNPIVTDDGIEYDADILKKVQGRVKQKKDKPI